MSKKGPIVYIAVGSNQSSSAGTPIDTLAHSLRLFGGESLVITSQSDWFETDAFPAGSGPDYINAVVEVETVLEPLEILAALHRIEAASERKRKLRWAARTCDLDLLCVGQEIAPSRGAFLKWQNLSCEEQQSLTPTRLILPHPRLQDRAFVLVPFHAIAPHWKHPVIGKTVAQMLADLPLQEIASVRRISPH